LLASIEQYREKYAVYPEALADLMPEFIDGIPTVSNDAGPKFAEYRRVNDQFEFIFQYFGPGMNWCVYSPDTEWSCDGHF
jgi:hypothetical protein